MEVLNLFTLWWGAHLVVYPIKKKESLADLQPGSVSSHIVGSVNSLCFFPGIEQCGSGGVYFSHTGNTWHHLKTFLNPAPGEVSIASMGRGQGCC